MPLEIQGRAGSIAAGGRTNFSFSAMGKNKISRKWNRREKKDVCQLGIEYQ